MILPEMEMMQFLPSHRNAVWIPACPVTVAFRRWKFKGVQKVRARTKSFCWSNKSGSGPVTLEIRNPLNYLDPRGMAFV